jgi:hypothetical protein
MVGITIGRLSYRSTWKSGVRIVYQSYLLTFGRVGCSSVNAIRGEIISRKRDIRGVLDQGVTRLTLSCTDQDSWGGSWKNCWVFHGVG